MVTARRALADTSVFIGLAAERLKTGRFESFEWGISAITLGELRLGVLRAANPDAASRKLSTYQLAQRFEALPVDEPVSDAWALLVSRLRAAARCRSTTAGSPPRLSPMGSRSSPKALTTMRCPASRSSRSDVPSQMGNGAKAA